jgi:hypothetical protein
MELDPIPIEDDDSFKSVDPQDCATSTMYYHVVPSQLVLSDHLISAFQQGHQTFPLVQLKDNIPSALGNTYYLFLPMVPIASSGPYLCQVPQPSFGHNFIRPFPCYAFKQQAFSY